MSGGVVTGGTVTGGIVAGGRVVEPPFGVPLAFLGSALFLGSDFAFFTVLASFGAWSYAGRKGRSVELKRNDEFLVHVRKN